MYMVQTKHILTGKWVDVKSFKKYNKAHTLFWTGVLSGYEVRIMKAGVLMLTSGEKSEKIG